MGNRLLLHRDERLSTNRDRRRICPAERHPLILLARTAFDNLTDDPVAAGQCGLSNAALDDLETNDARWTGTRHARVPDSRAAAAADRQCKYNDYYGPRFTHSGLQHPASRPRSSTRRSSPCPARPRDSYPHPLRRRKWPRKPSGLVDANVVCLVPADSRARVFALYAEAPAEVHEPCANTNARSARIHGVFKCDTRPVAFCRVGAGTIRVASGT
jgi:hypothetical protein